MYCIYIRTNPLSHSADVVFVVSATPIIGALLSVFGHFPAEGKANGRTRLYDCDRLMKHFAGNSMCCHDC